MNLIGKEPNVFPNSSRVPTFLLNSQSLTASDPIKLSSSTKLRKWKQFIHQINKIEGKQKEKLEMRGDRTSWKQFIHQTKKIEENKKRLEMRGIEPRASRMQSERSTIWATSPFEQCVDSYIFIANLYGAEWPKLRTFRPYLAVHLFCTVYYTFRKVEFKYRYGNEIDYTFIAAYTPFGMQDFIGKNT